MLTFSPDISKHSGQIFPEFAHFFGCVQNFAGFFHAFYIYFVQMLWFGSRGGSGSQPPSFDRRELFPPTPPPGESSKMEERLWSPLPVPQEPPGTERHAGSVCLIHPTDERCLACGSQAEISAHQSSPVARCASSLELPLHVLFAIFLGHTLLPQLLPIHAPTWRPPEFYRNQKGGFFCQFCCFFVIFFMLGIGYCA